MFQLLEGATPYHAEDAEQYRQGGWWRDLTLSDYLERAAGIHPDKVGFVDLENRVTYKEACEKAERLAVAFLRLGIKPLDRVMIQLPNWSEAALAYFALQKIGAITVMLIDRYRQHDVQRLARLTGASGWIVPLRYRKTDYLPVIHDVLRDCPQITNVITVRGESGGPGFSSLEQLMAETVVTQNDRDRLDGLRPHPDQVAHMGPTGGTTGAPKIVPRTHNSLACAVEYCSLSWGQHLEDVNLVVGSIGHDLSLSKGLLGSVMTMGTLVMLDTTDLTVTCETIEREQVSSIIWVPTLAQRLLQYEDLDKHDVSSLKKMHSGGGAAHPDLVREVFQRLHVRFHNGYGGTEGMTTITRPTDSIETVCTTVGRKTCPGDTYIVVDREDNRLGPDSEGELLIKGPSVFSGYYDNPAENAQIFDEAGFFRTGDLATLSENGYLKITGRIKEMINRGGESISATAIESLIQRHPQVAAVAVVPMPDPEMGERACAYIKPSAGADLTFEAIISFMREEKASVLELPERIEFIDTMPYTPAQKIDKQALRKDIACKLEDESQTTSGS